jgi:predicted CopG family antitoxin
MASHTVALDSDAYRALKAHKAEGESFSDVVKRLAKPKRSIIEFAGAWKDIPDKEWNAIEQAIRATREADRKRSERLEKMWDGS